MAKVQAVFLVLLIVTSPQMTSAFWRELGGFVAGGALVAVLAPLSPLLGPVVAVYASVKVPLILVGAAAGAHKAHESKDGGC